ncbi:PspC domain-containing protein [Streptomyces sp. NPDC008150]|uniref:PspC domain-containing protein n=1 Tax=Streptomyces sp. NPDC008150 TaxID=3364816 RepID=UPI0036E17B8C
MSDQQHAATGRGPGPGPGRSGPGPEPDASGRGGPYPGGRSARGDVTDGPAASGSSGGSEARDPGAAGGPSRTGGGGGGDDVPGSGSDSGSGSGSGSGGDVPGGDASAPPAGRLRRDREHQMLGGVCAGLGRQYDMDPVIFRIALSVLAVAGGFGLIFYGFAWLFVTYDDEDENEVRRLLTGRVDGPALAAVVFALAGCGVFLTLVRNGGVMAFAVILSALLAGAGYWSRQRGAPDPDPLAAQAAADAPPEAQAPPAPAGQPSWWRDPIVKDGTHVGGTGYLWGPRDARDRDVAAAVNISLGTVREDTRGGTGDPRDPRGSGDVRPGPRRSRFIDGWIVLVAAAAGFAGARAMWDDHPLGTSLQTGFAAALIVFGAGIAFSAFRGRTSGGTFFLAVLTAGLLACSAALPSNIDTDWRTPTWRPVAASQVRPSYEVGTGRGVLDLSGLEVPGGRTVASRAEVGLGRLVVIVPDDVTVRLTIDVGLGDIQLPGDDQDDVDVAPGKYEEKTLHPTRVTADGGRLDLDLHVSLGQVEVRRAAS